MKEGGLLEYNRPLDLAARCRPLKAPASRRQIHTPNLSRIGRGISRRHDSTRPSNRSIFAHLLVLQAIQMENEED